MATRLVSVVLLVLLAAAVTNAAKQPPNPKRLVKHVLMISIDGFHFQDLQNYALEKPGSTIGKLASKGDIYLNAYTPIPSDSAPGIVALTAGGFPKTSGVFYDVSYDRTLYPPGSKCQGPPGTVVAYDETADYNLTLPNGGGGLDPAHLPLDGENGCTPVYPHNYIKINTLFEVLTLQHKKRAAWCDKHFSYEMLNGPSGRGLKGISEFYSIEDAAFNLKNATIATAYDKLKAQVVLNWINGLTADGSKKAPEGTPLVYGTNLEQLNQDQKNQGHYLLPFGTFSPGVQLALDNIDDIFASFVAALKKRNQYDNTAIIITAKHGNSPIDFTMLKKVDPAIVSALIASVAGPNEPAHLTADDIGIIWLNDTSKRDAVVAALNAADRDTYGIEEVISGPKLEQQWGPYSDSRTPDIFIRVQPGTIYTTAKKALEHGGFFEDSRHIGLLISRPRKHGGVDYHNQEVSTTQIAPTILELLGYSSASLDAVALQDTTPLPYAFNP